MAKATAICTCKRCGARFEKTAIKYNRREADSWETWAVSYYDECPDCCAASKAATMEEINDVIEMHYSEYKRNYADCKTVPGSYDKSTKTIKVYVQKQEQPEEIESELPEITGEPVRVAYAVRLRRSWCRDDRNCAWLDAYIGATTLTLQDVLADEQLAENARIYAQEKNISSIEEAFAAAKNDTIAHCAKYENLTMIATATDAEQIIAALAK